MTDEIIAKVEGGVGRLTLNRPKALHALTTAMCQAMTEALLAWRDDEAVQLVMIDHAGERGFCAGGDIRMLAESGAGDGAEARAFFHTEYRLNALLEGYGKPTLAIMDGVTMGGGVGISLPCRYRVATGRTTFAMPETGIGLFPDVGGGWWLPRLTGESGMWLALTGARIKAADCLLLGLATDFIPSAALDAFKAQALADPAAVETALTEHGGDAGEPAAAAHRELMDRAFGKESVEAVEAALDAEPDPWAQAQLATLRAKSPQTLKVAFRQLREGAAMASFADEMRAEYRIGARVIHLHDFQEGVRAVIVDKDNQPRWRPAALAEVTDGQLDAIFAPLPAAEEWTPLP